MFTGNSLNFTGKFRPIVCIFPAPLYASNEAIFRPNAMRPFLSMRLKYSFTLESSNIVQ